MNIQKKNSMKRIAIIDDEQDARQMLRSMIMSLCPDVDICGEADNVHSAFMMIRQSRPHAILLDNSMEDGSGFDLLDKFENPDFQVIFTTAFDEFALRAFRYHAQDYLLKPINPVELSQALDRITTHSPLEASTQLSDLINSVRSGQLKKITLTSLEGLVFLNLDEIVRLESDGSYTIFYMINQDRHIVSRPMREFEELLPSREFFKLHQSHLVQLSFVKRVLREDGGLALMEDGSKVPIARRRKDEFLETIRERFKI